MFSRGFSGVTLWIELVQGNDTERRVTLYDHMFQSMCATLAVTFSDFYWKVLHIKSFMEISELRLCLPWAGAPVAQGIERSSNDT